MKKYYKKNPEQYSRHKKYVMNNDAIYKSQYYRHNITKEQLKEMVDKYHGKCHACRDRSGTAIDHDHSCCPRSYSCGKCIRGLLCNWCNSALGHVNDSVKHLNNLIRYLNSTA